MARPPVLQPDGRSPQNTWNWQPAGAGSRSVPGGVVPVLRHKGGDDPVVALLQGELQQQPVFSRRFVLGGRLGWGVFIPGLPGWVVIHG